MLSTALVPPPPTPMTVMRGEKSVWVIVGIVRLRVILFSPPSLRDGCWLVITSNSRFATSSDTFFQKIDKSTEQTDLRFPIQVDVLKGPSIAGCPGQQAGSGGKSRAGRELRQSAQC